MAAKSKKTQDRKFWGILYPDSESYDCEAVIEKIKSYFEEYAYILHDKDLDPEGNVLKPHYHWMGKSRSPLRISTISNQLGVAENYIRFIDRWRNCAQYLVHETKDTEDKYHYSVDEVVTNFEVTRFIGKESCETQARSIYDAITVYKLRSYADLIPWVLNNGCYGEFVRANSIWRSLIYELNAPLVEQPVETDLSYTPVRAQKEEVMSRVNMMIEELIERNEQNE